MEIIQKEGQNKRTDSFQGRLRGEKKLFRKDDGIKIYIVK